MDCQDQQFRQRLEEFRDISQCDKLDRISEPLDGILKNYDDFANEIYGMASHVLKDEETVRILN